MAKANATPTAKKLNIYVVRTEISVEKTSGNPLGQPFVKTDYVRAKTLAGAAAIIAGQYVTAKLATQDDLIKLANVSVVGEKGE